VHAQSSLEDWSEEGAQRNDERGMMSDELKSKHLPSIHHSSFIAHHFFSASLR
jgi:hypothetical protein